MVDSKLILNALIGAAAKRMVGGSAPAAGPGQAQSSLIDFIDEFFGPPGQGGAADPYVQKAREFVSRNSRLAEAALSAVAGVLMGSRKPGGIAVRAASLGGLALIGAAAASVALPAVRELAAERSGERTNEPPADPLPS